MLKNCFMVSVFAKHNGINVVIFVSRIQKVNWLNLKFIQLYIRNIEVQIHRNQVLQSNVWISKTYKIISIQTYLSNNTHKRIIVCFPWSTYRHTHICIYIPHTIVCFQWNTHTYIRIYRPHTKLYILFMLFVSQSQNNKTFFENESIKFRNSFY